ncbi:zinc finger protein 516-like [Gambusia affinis]|uniref:zinc finger protein 516-like n=1 Tax=Gambusia affinis TaxID=33528 RepID=UPI001CDD4E2C|nr:zinc finger protein 516-like [Gambusia affinis]XP_043995336.1 zinc finger protein 516-like [Gambusia affinis]XP_043995337.1 zinc finger protein 516-like [Gambusia affinis]
METEEKEDVSQKQASSTKEVEEDATTCHTCGVCGRSFPLLSSLSQHMRRHTREKPYKCPYCEHRTAQKGSLKAHIRSHKLGLLSKNPGDNEVEDDQEQKDEPDVLDLPEVISTSDKAHHINGKVKKKVTKKKVKSKNGVEFGDGPFSCIFCGQVFPQILLLKSHIKLHHSSHDHGCRICGRRFRQAWFLQSHMRIHRVKAQLQGSKNIELPATINGIPQDPASLINEECLYELCAGCGNFFKDRTTLRVHEKLHKLNPNPKREDLMPSELQVHKKHFLELLNLKSVNSKEPPEEEFQGRRIQELDPVCSYQAWQLATRGRLVESSEKCLGWEERLADAEVAYDTEKGEYVPLKQEKKRKQTDSSNSNVKKKKGDTGYDHTPNSLNHGRSGDKKIFQKDRIILNGLGQAFYEALQTKKVRELSSKQNKNIRSQEHEDKKSYSCEYCDFQTVDSSLLRSHLYSHRLGPCSKQSTTAGNISKSGSSRYMDYLKSRSVLLSQPYWSQYTYPPGQEFAEGNIKMENPNGIEMKEEVHTGGENFSLLNLSSSSVAVENSNYLVKTEGLVQHQCLYCSHTSNYPEVLWIHQRVTHRVDGSSSVAPKWAPCISILKSLKAGSSQWRRTGPPPFLEGKDCPALPTPRTQRTQPPGVATQSSSKVSSSKLQSSIPRPKHHPKDSHSSDATHSRGKVVFQPQRKSGEHKRVVDSVSKASIAQVTSINSSVHTKSLSNFQTSSSPKHRGNRVAVEGVFPQEGLGFMLARNQSGTSSNTAADKAYSRRQSWDFSSGLKGPDLWAAMNMWGLHGGKAYLEPHLFAQGKSDSTGDTPKEMDLLSLLKSYSPHELAGLYQHWGYVDPRLDPQATLQLNGSFGNEVHSSTESPKQKSSRSTPSSGSLHKGT